jgi:hypothetical protein
MLLARKKTELELGEFSQKLEEGVFVEADAQRWLSRRRR